MTDKQLLKSCLEGDVDKFRQIVDKYRGKVTGMAINILGNKEDAEDACQETFINVYQNLDKFDFERNFKDWLFTILYNRCIDKVRKRTRFYNFFNKKKIEYHNNHNSDYRTNPENMQIISDSLLQKLSPKERTAVYLWAYEGYTSDELGVVLNCSSSTARVHIFKARKKLKKILENGHDTL
ncbi:MAG: RNA polymerase sigma factor [Candidatus Aminicenantes bacterium]|jgi:RNA polymerase sigma-70 factor (ECF subfamily)